MTGMQNSMWIFVCLCMLIVDIEFSIS